MSISPILMVMARAIEKASRSLVRDFGEVEKLQISVKGPGDFVSRADKRSEEIIIESLQKDRPDWGILAEESGTKAGSDPRYRWIIDPLDGTTNFLHGLPHWCVTVALERDGDLIAAMTFDPIRQEMFRAEKGGGAFVNNTRLRVAGRKKIENLLIGLSCTKPMEQTSMLYQKGCSIRIAGSGALDIAYLAAGRLDVAYMDTGCKAWDIAAGILLVREAGGTATDLTLKSAAALSDVGVLAANPTLHKEYADLLGLSK